MANYKECPSCGTEIAKNAKKCPFCGVKLKKPFYKRGGFVFLVWLCILGGLGYVGATQFHLNYVNLAQDGMDMLKRGGSWLHSVIVADNNTPAPEVATEPAPAEPTATEPKAEEKSEQPAAPAKDETTEAAQPTEPIADTPKSETAEEVVVCTAAELTKSFEKNVLAGNLTYRNHICRVSGQIKSFGEIGEQAYVVLEGWDAGSMVGVRCFVNSMEDIKTLAAMTVGQSLTMEGVCTGLSMNVDVADAHITSALATTEASEVKKPVTSTPKTGTKVPIVTRTQPTEEAAPQAAPEVVAPETKTVPDSTIDNGNKATQEAKTPLVQKQAAR